MTLAPKFRHDEHQPEPPHKPPRIEIEIRRCMGSAYADAVDSSPLPHTRAEAIAMSTLTVTVTNDHIQRGLSGSATSCPIALAIREKFDYDWPPVVFRDRINLPDNRLAWPSKRATQFIDAFDIAGAPGVAPATFRFKLA